MLTHIKFFGGMNKEKNIQAIETLEKLTNVELELTVASPILEEEIDLPFIYTNEGNRYYGLNDIKDFVNQRFVRLSINRSEHAEKLVNEFKEAGYTVERILGSSEPTASTATAYISGYPNIRRRLIRPFQKNK